MMGGRIKKVVHSKLGEGIIRPDLNQLSASGRVLVEFPDLDPKGTQVRWIRLEDLQGIRPGHN